LEGIFVDLLITATLPAKTPHVIYNFGAA